MRLVLTRVLLASGSAAAVVVVAVLPVLAAGGGWWRWWRAWPLVPAVFLCRSSNGPGIQLRRTYGCVFLILMMTVKHFFFRLVPSLQPCLPVSFWTFEG